MSAVIIELQREALDREVSVSDLLRKSLVVARKLGLDEFRDWIEKELSGYEDTNIPSYREVSGQIRGWNPYNGWIPLQFEDPKEAEIFSRRKTGQSIAQLEHLIQSGEGASLHMPFPHEVQQQLSKGFGYQTQVSLCSGLSMIVGIVDAVRTVILNWALKLEEDGIMGEGLSFSAEERDAAARSSQNITNFYGPVQTSQVQQGSPGAVQVATTVDIAGVAQLIDSLRPDVDAMGFAPDQKAELEAEIETLAAQSRSPRPKTLVVRESLATVRRIIEGAGGGAAAHFLVDIARLLGS